MRLEPSAVLTLVLGTAPAVQVMAPAGLPIADRAYRHPESLHRPFQLLPVELDHP